MLFPWIPILVLLIVPMWIDVSLSYGDSDCDKNGFASTLIAPYAPGQITLDGDSKDWKSIKGETFKLTQAIGPAAQYPQGSGSMTIKVVHDGERVFFLLQAPGAYVWSSETPHLGPSVSLMFGIGDNATLYQMGGCPASSSECSEVTCAGHEVDLLQFQLHTAIPGRLYGGNLMDNMQATGQDSVGHLRDMFGWNPYCKFYDSPPPSSGINSSSPLLAASGAQNDWQGAWSHTSITNEFGLTMKNAPFAAQGEKGEFVFEFARPMRTPDRYQQDIQFTIGSSHQFGAALWYPVNNAAWGDSQHYISSCDWTSLEIQSGTVNPPTSFSLTTALVILSCTSLIVLLSAIVNYFMFRWCVERNSRHFIPFESSNGL